jgi:hypothetical protein
VINHQAPRRANAPWTRSDLADLLQALDEHRLRLGRSIDSIETVRAVAGRTRAASATTAGMAMQTVLAYSSAALRTCDAEIGTLVTEFRQGRDAPTAEERDPSG